MATPLTPEVPTSRPRSVSGTERGVYELVGADGVLGLLGMPQLGLVDLRGDPVDEPPLEHRALHRADRVLGVGVEVTLAPRFALHQGRGEAEEQARSLLDRFGLSDKVEAYPDHLSGGQQQRVAIVRALAMQPRLMLLDEVTSALDPELVAEVLDVIGELAAGGMTMVIATHEMGFARDIATRVCFLDDGVILEQGPPEQMFGSPREPRTQQFLQRIVSAHRL